MKSPGTLLREAREERGLTLDDVAAMTRIPKVMVGHLEDDRFDEYVADVFARGHLRNYARELGLDDEEILQAYERQTGRRRTKTPEGSPIDDKWNPGSSPTTGSGASAVMSAAKGTGAHPGVEAGAVTSYLGSIRRTHLVGIVLVLAGLFLMFGYLSNNRATAQDPAEFEEADEADWELEQDVQETRWLLEQSE